MLPFPLRFLLLVFACGCPELAWAEVRLPKVFTDGMVVQQQMPIRVWGWASPGEKVTVELAGKVASSVAGEQGRWRVELPPLDADGKPQELTVAATNKIVLRDVLLGEVWLAVGQSNMSRGLRYVKNRVINEPMEFTNLRLFFVCLDQTPQREEAAVTKGWASATHDAMKSAFVHPTLGPYEFSEVTFYFGKTVHEKLGVPVGMISCAFPGSTAGQWTPADPARFDFESKQADKGPGSMYQSMLLGLPPLAIRGVIYYQGENDAGNANYRKDLKTLIEAWRARFERPEMPFYMTQLGQTTFGGGTLGVISSQRWVLANVPHTGLATSNDLIDGANPQKARAQTDKATGFPIIGGGDPHPPNKHVVAGRLAQLALVQTYGKPVGASMGPQAASFESQGPTLRVAFKHVGQGLKTDDGQPPNWFEIAGEDRKFVPASAKIVDIDTVALDAAGVSAPKHFRFAWHALARHNLYGGDGLPAPPTTGDDLAAKSP